jgi:hypothetical protein
MAQWLAARQRGVEMGRGRVKHEVSEVAVYHAAEVNLVKSSMDRPGFGNVVDLVLPHVALDLVSYSCYDTVGDQVRAWAVRVTKLG